MKRFFKSRICAVILIALMIFLPSLGSATSVTVQVVYDGSTFRLTPPSFPPGVTPFYGSTFEVFARVYPAGTIKPQDCSTFGQGCGFDSNGNPLPGSIGVLTCSGWFITSSLNDVLSNLGQPGYQAAVYATVANHAGEAFVRATGTFDFNATINQFGAIQKNPGTSLGQNMIITEGYLGIPSAVLNPPDIFIRSVTGGSGTVTIQGVTYTLTGLSGASQSTVLGFFANARGLITENVTFQLTSVQNKQ